MFKGDGWLPFLAALGRPLVPQEEVGLDFSELRRVTPAGLVDLVATVVRWRRDCGTAPAVWLISARESHSHHPRRVRHPSGGWFRRRTISQGAD